MGKIATNIKGSFGETVCRIHFEAMGYDVDPIGIERIAPSFCKVKHSSGESGAYWDKLEDANFSNIPDCLMSRINKEGQKEAVLVEVKYRKNFKAEALKKELKKTYASYSNFPIIFYVIAGGKEPCIYILYSDKGNQYKWYTVDNMKNFPIYQATSDTHLSLQEAYEQIVLPILKSVELTEESDKPAKILNSPTS